MKRDGRTIGARKSARFSSLGLALALSAGTIAGFAMVGLASQAAQAQAAGGNGGGSGGNGGNGGESAPLRAETPARQQPRVVQVHGFAGCAVVQQRRGPDGAPTFFCARTM